MPIADNGSSPWWLRILERFGIPSAVLATVLYFLMYEMWPEHKNFLNKISGQQETQTEVLQGLERLQEKSSEINRDGFDNTNEVLKDALETTTKNGEKLDTLHTKVDAVKAAVEKRTP